MQLYKPRGFGEFFQDTFAFLKQNGKHFFKHFFIVNGLFILILMVLGYFFSKFYREVFFGGIVYGNPDAMDAYINDNIGLFILFVVVFVVVGLTASVISYAFVPIYLNLYAKQNGTNFTATDLIQSYKKNIGNIFIFLICGILVAIPLMIFVGLLAFILTITIVGILALPLIVGGVSLYYQGTLMEYLERKKSIWESFGYSWKLMSTKFWAAILCVGLFFLMAYIMQYIVAIIPYILGMVELYTNIDPSGNLNPEDVGNTVSIMMLAIFAISFLVSSMLSLIVQLNIGIVFYSLKEENENINTKSDIDLIGSGE
ncbi:MAG: hypothetical protein GYB32_06015 [Algicola sp.]|nr:hypothetical protein [Algicola sp.]